MPFNLKNITSNNSVWKSSSDILDGVCPKWIIFVYLAFLVCGSCLNLLESFALLKSTKNGVLSIILQILLTDILLLSIAVIDVLGSYFQTWKYSSQICLFYSGTEILANTLIIYLIVCLNFHIITFWNLHNIEVIKNNRNPLTSFSESSSSECLVTRSENRIVGIDYKKRKNDVPIVLPTIFVWILCLSMSVPKYVLSSTVEIQGKTLCAIIQTNYNKILHVLFLTFSVMVPCLLLLISLSILIYKLSNSFKNNIDNVLTKQCGEIRKLLIFSIVLTMFYMSTSFQRHIFNVARSAKGIFILETHYYNNFLNVYQTMLHYSGTALRGFIFYYAVSDVKRAVTGKVLFCFNKEV